MPPTLLLMATLCLAPDAGSTDDAVRPTVDDEEEEVDIDLDDLDEPAFGDEPGETIEEDVNLDDLSEKFPLPEYVYRPWLVTFPILCGLVLAFNVNWRRKRRRAPRVRRAKK